MRTSSKILLFAAGVAVGTAATWFGAKKYWEQVANEEIESMKEWVARRVEETEETEEEEESVETTPVSPSVKPDLHELVKGLNYDTYTDYSNTRPKPEETTEEEVDDYMDDGVYVIKPEIFGEEDDYEEYSLTYYADGVLCDERDNIIEDVTSMVVPDFADYFGMYEDDAVYVRNEHLKTDYEILADLRKYTDIYSTEE